MSRWVVSKDDTNRLCVYKDGSLLFKNVVEQYHDFSGSGYLHVVSGVLGYIAWNCSSGDTVDIESPGTYWMPFFFGSNQNVETPARAYFVPRNVKDVALRNASGGDVVFTLSPVGGIANFAAYWHGSLCDLAVGQVRYLFPFSNVSGISFDGVGVKCAGSFSIGSRTSAWSLVEDFQYNTGLSVVNPVYNPVSFEDCLFRSVQFNLVSARALRCQFYDCSGQLFRKSSPMGFVDSCIFKDTVFSCSRHCTFINSFFENNSFIASSEADTGVFINCGLLDNENLNCHTLVNSYLFGNGPFGYSNMFGCIYDSDLSAYLGNTTEISKIGSSKRVQRPPSFSDVDAAIEGSLDFSWHAFSISQKSMKNIGMAGDVPDELSHDWVGNERNLETLGVGPVYPYLNIDGYYIVRSSVVSGLGSVEPRVAFIPKGSRCEFVTGVVCPGNVVDVVCNGRHFEPAREIAFYPEADCVVEFTFTNDIYFDSESGSVDGDGSEARPFSCFSQSIACVCKYLHVLPDEAELGVCSVPNCISDDAIVVHARGEVSSDPGFKQFLYSYAPRSYTEEYVRKEVIGWLECVPLIEVVVADDATYVQNLDGVSERIVLVGDGNTEVRGSLSGNLLVEACRLVKGSSVSSGVVVQGCHIDSGVELSGVCENCVVDASFGGLIRDSRVGSLDSAHIAKNTKFKRCRTRGVKPGEASSFEECALTDFLSPSVLSFFETHDYFSVLGLVKTKKVLRSWFDPPTKGVAYSAAVDGGWAEACSRCVFDAGVGFVPPWLLTKGHVSSFLEIIGSSQNSCLKPLDDRLMHVARLCGVGSVDFEEHERRAVCFLGLLLHSLKSAGMVDILQMLPAIYSMFDPAVVWIPTWKETWNAADSKPGGGVGSYRPAIRGYQVICYVYGGSGVSYADAYVRDTIDLNMTSIYLPRLSYDYLVEANNMLNDGSLFDCLKKSSDGRMFFAERVEDFPGSYVSAFQKLLEKCGLSVSVDEFLIDKTLYRGIEIEV